MHKDHKRGITRRSFSTGTIIGALASAPMMAQAQAQSAAMAANPSASAVLAALRGEYPIPALSAAVVRDGELVWSDAQGTADLELGVPALPDHLFRLGSVSKVVTVAVCARLAQAGIVDLDAPIATYREDLPAQHRATSLRQLCNHQGGIRHYGGSDYDPSAPGGMIDSRIYRGTQDALALFIDDPLEAAPGSAVSYSTYGYTLISAVLESATGKGFGDLVAEEVASPLMLGELHLDDPLKAIARRISNYDPPELYVRFMPVPDAPVVNSFAANPAYKWAGGGMVASARDIARFGGAHLQDGYLRSQTRRTLFDPVTQASERMPALGLGWRVDSSPTLGKRYHHAGNMQGCRAQIALYPDHGLSIALLSNLGGTPRDILGITEQIAANFVS